MNRTVVAPFVLALALAGCTKDKPQGDAPPVIPEPAASSSTTGAAAASACASGGGQVNDAITSAFFPRAEGGYCVDPQGETRTYGEKGKYSMDEVCTTAFDGECEVYKRFGLKRVVSLRYVDGGGGGGTVEVNLSQFADAAGAYGMFTLRVVAGDPAEPSTPKVLEAGGASAIGTGRAYVWRGQHLAELQYVNEQESPEQLAKSSDAILKEVAKDHGAKLPGPTALPAAAQALPGEHRIANGIVFHPKDVLSWNGVGPGALGFYKEGDRRWRVLSIVKDDADQAKDAFKTMKAKPGTLPVPAMGDEAAHLVVGGGKDGGASVEFLVARKGNVIWGVGDEEYALRAAGAAGLEKARLTKDEAIAKLKPLLAAGPPAGATSAGGSPSATPSASASAKKK